MFIFFKENCDKRNICSVCNLYRFAINGLFSFFIFLLTSVSVYSQEETLQKIESGFKKYNEANLQEKLFVHTDRNSYVAGEIVWFKIYCVNAANNQFLDLSKVAYVEVLDKDNQPVLQAKISLQNGNGNGSLTLPSTLQSGNYTFRAYTNWMKNFDAEFYFQKTITIINTIQKGPDVTEKKPEQFDVQFFPEGGDLVNGLQSKVAFRVTDESGRGTDFSGAIINQNNDTVTKFHPAKFGIGSFIFTPAKNSSYKAVIKTSKQNAIIQNLPDIKDNGFVMTVSDNEKDNKLQVTIHSNRQDYYVYLFIHSQQHIAAAQILYLKDGSAQTEIDKNKLGDGISHLTLFNIINQPVCERLYFKRLQKKLAIDANADNTQYATRKKVTIDVSTKDELQKATVANMSVAVYLADSTPVYNDDIYSYLWLSSDLQGKAEHPEFYFADTSAPTNEALDNLVLTYGWRRFKWTDVLTDKQPVLRFPPEYEGHLVSGKIVNAESRTPEENIVALLSVPGRNFQLYSSKSNSDGSIYFNTKDLYGSRLIVAGTNAEQNSKYRIDFTSPFSENYSAFKTPASDYSANAATNILQRSINMQVKNIFAGDTVYSLPAPIDTVHFFGKPDGRSLLEDYTRFPTMEEVLREYVREINVRKRSNHFSLTMVNKNENGDADIKSPVVLLDGVPQFDNGNKITRYDALKVKELEIIQEKYYLGPATFDGIASFTTYKGDLAGFELDTAAAILDYDALQLKREFYSPRYETKDEVVSRMPDFRNLLYWKPNLQTDKNGKQQISFYTSDQPGKFAVVMQGLSSSGNAGSKTFMIEVKKKR